MLRAYTDWPGGKKWKDGDVRARSVSASVLPLFWGPARRGVSLGAGHLAFDNFVVSLTAPGRARMPNGVESDLVVQRGQPCWLGEGRLEAGGRVVLPGPGWDAVPATLVRLSVDRRFSPRPDLLAGRGAGLTPSGDDLLCGYVAGLVLWHGRSEEARAIASTAAALTTLLSGTLLRHAAGGELPEPAHALLERGDPEPLRRFGHSSGRAILVGLALAC
jgi:Protein of unknown function (DUF2877)